MHVKKEKKWSAHQVGVGIKFAWRGVQEQCVGIKTKADRVNQAGHRGPQVKKKSNQKLPRHHLVKLRLNFRKSLKIARDSEKFTEKYGELVTTSTFYF